MTVVMCSMWRNDATSNLSIRAHRLLDKRNGYDDLRLVWVVGDSDDETYERLGELVTRDNHQTWVRLILHDTHIEGDDATNRTRRLSQTANVWFRNLDDAEYVMVHESDLITPENIVNRFVDHAEAGRCPIAGWPVLQMNPSKSIFYDVWAYRKNGRKFSNHEPYHPDLNGEDIFTVDSFGSCWMALASDLRNFEMRELAVRDACAHLTNAGRKLWVDRTIEVIQPKEHFRARRNHL